MDLWNQKQLPVPPTNTCKMHLMESDYRLLGIAINDGVKLFENQPHLHREAALLSRFIYRIKTKFRNHKEMKYVSMINRCLLTYLRMDMLILLQNLKNLVPREYRIKMYLPTKNLIDHCLVRLQGLAKLFAHTIGIDYKAAIALQSKLRLGHAWQTTIMLYAIVSRIHVIILAFLRSLCHLYSNLIVFSKKLCNTGIKWLPDNYKFPDNLSEWLNIDMNLLPILEINDNDLIVDDDDKSLTSFMDLTQTFEDNDDDDVQIDDEYILIDDEPKQKKMENKMILEGFGGDDGDDDVGEVVRMPEKRKNNWKNKKNGKRRKNCD